MIADEVTDSSNKEQLGVVLRYVNPTDKCNREDLVSFLECSGGISGQALADMLLDFLTKHGLDPTNFVDKPMMVLVIWQEGSRALQHASCLHFLSLSMYTVPPTVLILLLLAHLRRLQYAI